MDRSEPQSGQHVQGRRPGKRTRLRRIGRYSITVAASILLIITVYWAYTFYTISASSLYSGNYKPYELSTSAVNAPTAATAIEKAYREKNYEEVIRLSQRSGISAREIFLTGLSFMETGDLTKAISSFQVVLAETEKSNTRRLQEETEYYLALAFLKNRDYDQSIELMSQVSDNPLHSYRKKFPGKFIRRVKMLKWR